MRTHRQVALIAALLPAIVGCENSLPAVPTIPASTLATSVVGESLPPGTILYMAASGHRAGDRSYRGGLSGTWLLPGLRLPEANALYDVVDGGAFDSCRRGPSYSTAGRF